MQTLTAYASQFSYRHPKATMNSWTDPSITSLRRLPDVSVQYRCQEGQMLPVYLEPSAPIQQKYLILCLNFTIFKNL